MRHELKTWPGPFAAVLSGNKRFEMRFDDRNYKVLDTLVLQEYDPGTEQYSGRQIECTVTHIMRGTDPEPWVGLTPGYVVLGIEPAADDVETMLRDIAGDNGLLTIALGLACRNLNRPTLTPEFFKGVAWAMMQEKPQVRLLREAKPDHSEFFTGGNVLQPGVYDVEINPNGAVTAVDADGNTLLGLRPDEFEWVRDGNGWTTKFCPSYRTDGLPHIVIRKGSAVGKTEHMLDAAIYSMPEVTP